MQLTFTDEQALVRQSASDWLAEHLPYQARRHGEAPPFRDTWKEFAELGWLGLPFPERWGGSGCGGLEAFALCESLGRHLVVQPYIPSVLVGGRLLMMLADDAQAQRWAPGLIDGSERLAWAHDEPEDETPWGARHVRAIRQGDGWTLSGTKILVEGAQAATLWLVTATLDEGLQQVFAVSPAVSGVRQDSYTGVQGARFCDLVFDRVELPASAALGAWPGEKNDPAGTALRQCVAEGVIASCWAASGAMTALVEQTAAFVTTRKQFGKPLSAFQAVQHSVAEMIVQSAEAQAMCELAGARLQLASADAVDISMAARIKVARAAGDIARRAVQLHGAMGVCDELPVAAAYRWLEAFQTQHGRWHQSTGVLAETLLANGRYRHSAVLGAGA